MGSHGTSVPGDVWRNVADFVTLSHVVVTFWRGLASYVHGLAEAKSGSRTWFVSSARRVIAVGPTARFGSALPFETKSLGVRQERFAPVHGNVAFPFSNETPCSVRPGSVARQLTVRDAFPLSVSVGTARTGADRIPRSRVTAKIEMRRRTWGRCLRLCLFVTMD